MQLWRYGHAIEKLGKRYQLKKVLGSGGMADVCLAWDEQERREVAVKVIKLDHLNMDIVAETLPDLLNRFLKEGSLVAHWHHPHILRVYDDVRLEVLDAAQGSMVPYIVMEYVPSGDLQSRLQAGQPLSLDVTLRIFEQLCDAVQYAHDHEVIHRDIKPSNVLFRRLPDGSEQAVLSDFGLAVSTLATHHTFPAAGTPAYMAPEQHRGQAQKASDIFALGVLLYRLCTGKLPFASSLIPRPLEKPVTPSVHNPALPKALDVVILTALAEDPAQRFARADVFMQCVQTAAASATGKIRAVSPYKTDAMRSSSNNPLQTNAPPASDESALVLLPPYSSISPLPVQEEDVSPIVVAPPTRLVSDLRLENPSITNKASTARPDAKKVDTSLSGVVPLPVDSSRKSVPSTLKNIDESRVHSSRVSQSPLRGVKDIPLQKNRRTAGNARASKTRKWGIGALLLLVALLLISVSMIYNGIIPIGRPAATITITPANQLVADSYAIDGVTGNPDLTKLQISTRQITQNTQQQKTVAGSGHNQQPGVKASGTLTFSNGSGVSFTVAAGTQVRDKDGIIFVTNAAAVIPPASPASGQLGVTTVPAHAANVGANGNISVLAINETCCNPNGSVFVKNQSAFVGGQDPKNYNFVQQSDVNAVVSPLTQPLVQQAWSSVQK